MRCENCQKFVSYDTEVEPEESNSPELEDGVFTASFTRTLSCAECGSEMKSAEIEVEVDATITEPEKEEYTPTDQDKIDYEVCKVCGRVYIEHDGTEVSHRFEGTGEQDYELRELEEDDHEHDWQCEVESVSPTERMQTHDRHGKPIKRARYMRRYYGVEGTLSATCDCGATATADFNEDVQASGFDELM